MLARCGSYDIVTSDNTFDMSRFCYCFKTTSTYMYIGESSRPALAFELDQRVQRRHHHEAD